MSNSRTYKSWVAMNSRCYNSKSISYKYYGGRGITVCDEWRHDFMKFYEDLGERPPKTSLDRLDHNGNYEPGNVRWANKYEQAANTRSNANMVGVTYSKWLGKWTASLSVNGWNVLSGHTFGKQRGGAGSKAASLPEVSE
jgi:phosphodiesterase/alkaline phosphatase D-like protein